MAFQKALELQEKVLGSNHPSLGSTLLDYAALLRRLGKKAEAKGIKSRADEILAGSGLRTDLMVDVAELEGHTSVSPRVP